MDIIAEDVDDLLRKLNGRRVNVNGTMLTLSTANLSRAFVRDDWKNGCSIFFADPQMVFLLFINAVAGIGMEFKSPGLSCPV